MIFSIRPSIARWAVHQGVFDANARIQAFAAKNPKLHFVDMTPLLLGADGQPARELLDDDLHHLNVAGFDKATAKIKPVIAEAEAAYWRGRKTAGASPQRSRSGADAAPSTGRVMKDPGSPAARHDIGALLDTARAGAYQRWLVFLTAITVVFDGIDNQLLGVVLPTVMREWGIDRSALAPAVSLGYAGMMAGGALAGIAGDRFGRRQALLGSVAVFGAMTLATAAVNDLATLAALRFLSGIGLGGALPNAATLAAEFVPRAQRPMAVTATIVCVPLGAMLAGILGSQLLETTGWRALFVAGGVVPLVAAVALARLLPESPRFLARHPSAMAGARAARRQARPSGDARRGVRGFDGTERHPRANLLPLRRRVPARHDRALVFLLQLPACRLPRLQLAADGAGRRGLRLQCRE